MQVCKTVYLLRIFSFLPCYFCSLHLGVQNYNKDPAIKCFDTAFCTCAFTECTVLNYLSMIPSSLPSRKNISSHWLLSWLEPFFVCVQPEVCSTAYQTILVLQLFRSEPGMCCSFQSIHLYFLLKETKAVEKVGREKQCYCC